MTGSTVGEDGIIFSGKVFMSMKMYDLLNEEPEENSPAYDREEPNKYDDKFEFEIVLDNVGRDLYKFNSDSTEYRLAVSSTELANGSLRILPDIYLNNGSQISQNIIYDIFVHVYNECIKKGAHLFSNKAINDSKLSIMTPDIEIKYGEKFYDNGSFLFSLREILPREVVNSLETKFDMKYLFGHGAVPEENIFDVPKQNVKSFNDLNSFQRQAIRNTLVIPDGVIPAFNDNFNLYRERAIKRGKSILMALSKGTYNGKPYTLDTKRVAIYLWSANKHDSDNIQSSVDKETFTIKPDFRISIGSRIQTYDGKPADEFSSTNWEEYYKLLQFVKQKFEKYDIHFG